jgi:hypothetical protein
VACTPRGVSLNVNKFRGVARLLAATLAPSHILVINPGSYHTQQSSHQSLHRLPSRSLQAVYKIRSITCPSNRLPRINAVASGPSVAPLHYAQHASTSSAAPTSVPTEFHLSTQRKPQGPGLHHGAHEAGPVQRSSRDQFSPRLAISRILVLRGRNQHDQAG